MEPMFRIRLPIDRAIVRALVPTIVLGAVIALLGIALAVGKIVADGEPGAIPLALIAVGVAAVILGHGRLAERERDR